MVGSTHLACGAATAVVAARVAVAPLGTTAVVAFIAGTLLGSLLPDMDYPRSLLPNLPRMLTRRAPRPISTVGFMATYLLCKLAKVIYHCCGHRGTTHHPAIYAGLAALLLAMPAHPHLAMHDFLIGVLLGCVLHLVMDGTTVTGLPFLPGWRLHLLPAPLRHRVGRVPW